MLLDIPLKLCKVYAGAVLGRPKILNVHVIQLIFRPTCTKLTHFYVYQTMKFYVSLTILM